MNEEKWLEGLRYNRLSRHLRVDHGQTIPSGVPNRKHLVKELHDALHKLGCGHDKDWGLK